nr:RNA polymerase sigma factor [Marseilla massiliensis]
MANGLRRGDTTAVARFYTMHAPYLAGVCSRYVASPDDTKDVFHDAMVKIMQHAGEFSYRGPGSLRSWATRIVANEAVNFLRARRKTDFASLDNMPDTPDEPTPDVTEITPEEIHSLIRKLPDGYRTVFNLYAIEGKSHREIANMLGIKEASSASQYHRARNMLAHMIHEYRQQRQQ